MIVSSARIFTRTLAVGLALGGLINLGACDQRSGGSTIAPDGQGTDSVLRPEGSFEGESIDELELRLQHLVEGHEQRVAVSSQDPDVCEELCELSKSICEVKAKMCEIADERVGDDEYQNLCRVAKQRCGRASESCVRCVQHHQRSSNGLGTSAQPAGDCGGD